MVADFLIGGNGEMLCEECRRRPATVHITKIVNNMQTEIHLCQDCAQSKGELTFVSQPTFTFQDFLTGMLQHAQSMQPGLAVETSVGRCPNCGFTYAEFKATGRLGCSVCYEQFKGQIQPLLRRIQGSTGHTGKVPGHSSAAIGYRRQIEELREQQRDAIAQERYEEAAKLRDKIQSLEKNLRESEARENR
jgi:protein arginine kinase activator